MHKDTDDFWKFEKCYYQLFFAQHEQFFLITSPPLIMNIM